MFTKFWEQLATGTAGSWHTRLFGPAAAFWGSGVLAWVWRYGGHRLLDFLQTADTVTGIILIVAGLFILLVSDSLMQWLTLPILRFAEGYWPRVLNRLRHSLVSRHARRYNDLDDRWQPLARQFEVNPDQLSAEEKIEYARLDAELKNYPLHTDRYLPTRLGNILRAAEEYPYLRYGLETINVWPRLWLIVPEASRIELNRARQMLDSRVHILAWGVLLAIWAIWAWWMLPIAALIAFIAYRSIIDAAVIYGDLLRAAFDLHRFDLYESLRWPLPERPSTEDAYGQAFTQYLHRGLAEGQMTFKHPEKEK